MNSKNKFIIGSRHGVALYYFKLLVEEVIDLCGQSVVQILYLESTKLTGRLYTILVHNSRDIGRLIIPFSCI